MTKYQDAPEHLIQLEEERSDVYHKLANIEVNPEERIEELQIKAKPELSEFKRKLEAEREVIKIYVKGWIQI